MKTKIFITLALFLCVVALNSCVESPIYTQAALNSVNSNLDVWRGAASIKPYLALLNLLFLLWIFWAVWTFRVSKKQ